MAVSGTFVDGFWILSDTPSTLGNLFSCFYIWTHLDHLNRKPLKKTSICVIIPRYYNMNVSLIQYKTAQLQKKIYLE